jgi:FxsC-like protein
VSVSRRHPLPIRPGPPDLRYVTSVFHPAPSRARVSQFVHFIVSAGSRQEMRSYRQNLAYYGDSCKDWAPYHNDLTKPLAAFASAIAAKRQFDSDVSNIDGLDARIDRAKALNQLVVLLVDAWSVKFDRHRQALSRYDARTERTNAVMIPWNLRDEETHQHWLELDRAIQELLWHNARRDDQHMFRRSIPTHDDFSACLEEVLEEARNRVFAEGEVMHLPPETGVERPFLEGPEAQDGEDQQP